MKVPSVIFCTSSKFKQFLSVGSHLHLMLIEKVSNFRLALDASIHYML
jgi:hypothetical protein